MTGIMTATLDDVSIQKAKSGDLEALESVYRAYEHTVYAVARRICRAPEDAEDVMQETFLEICKSISNFRGTGSGSLAGWVKRVAASKALMKIRREKYRDTEVRSARSSRAATTRRAIATQGSARRPS